VRRKDRRDPELQDSLSARFRIGDSAALEEVIDRYSAYAAKIISVFLNQTLPPEDMEETLSDTFLALWGSRERIEGDIKPYLAAVARNAARTRLRKYHPMEPLPEEPLLADGAPTPEQATEKAEQRAAVHQALEALNSADQELFLRFYYLDQTVAEIAAVTAQNESTLKSRLKRGREKMRQYLIERGLA
jgi:RNA polymerase sigma-70 factor (ECF subfamily)